jgi:hypothetical protein
VLSDLYEKLLWRHGDNSELLGACKVLGVERDDEITLTFDRHFQDEIVFRIGQKRPLAIEHRPPPAPEEQPVQNVVDELLGDLSLHTLPLGHLLVLKRQRDRQIRLPARISQQIQEPEGSATPRAERRHEDIGIDHDLVHSRRRSPVVIVAGSGKTMRSRP